MHVSRGVFDVGTATRKLISRVRGPPQTLRPEWPVISAIRPLFYLLRFFGLVPFEISKDHFIPRSYDAIYSIFCALVHTYAIYIVLNKPALKRDTVILDIIENGKIIINYCILMLNIFVAVWTRKEFIRVLNTVKHFDSRVRELGYPRKEGHTKVWVWSTCICTAFLWTTVSRFGMMAFNEYWIDNVTYLVHYLATSLSTIKFSSAVLLLGQRFRYLTKIAQLCKESTTNKRKHIPNDSEVIQGLHNSLMTAGESLSSQYAWPLFLWLGNLCIHSVSNVYFLIDWIVATPDWVGTQWPLINCLSWWLVTYVVQLLLLHVTCHFTSSEANDVRWIMINRKTLAESRNYLSYMRPNINRKLSFTAAGCFPVNLPLLRSTTALLTTYLVLLVQFQAYK